MNLRSALAAPLLAGGLLAGGGANALDDIELSADEQRRLGIQVLTVTRVERPDLRDAIGRVLDPLDLAQRHAEVSVMQASHAASQAEADRSEQLHRAGQNASLRQWQAALATARADQARLQAAQQTLALRWGAELAAMDPHRRAELLDDLGARRSSLLRVVAPGLSGSTAARLRWEHDGPLQVLGIAAQAVAGVPGTALLVLAPRTGLQPGTSLSLQVEGRVIKGIQVPASALLGDGRGLSVYRRVAPTRFERVVVRVRLDAGEQVLVEGLPEGAEVVGVNAATLRWAASVKLRAGSGAGDDGDDD